MKYSALILTALSASVLVSCENAKPTPAKSSSPGMTSLVVMDERGTRVVEVPTSFLPEGDAEGKTCQSCGGSGEMPSGVRCPSCYGLGSTYR